MAKSWYAFLHGDPLNSKNYAKITGKHDCLCGDMISVVYATGDQVHPDGEFSQNLQQYIRAALATGQLQPAKPYDAKKYVYLKEGF